MLIDKGFSNGDIVSLKLTNGDELIARFDSETAEEVKVVKPLVITIGAQGLGMMPWMFLGDKDLFTLKKQHIFTMIPSKKDAANQYMQGTTGISLL
jgi:hypothetical protein